jgi:hypothetical protein
MVMFLCAVVCVARVWAAVAAATMP